MVLTGRDMIAKVQNAADKTCSACRSLLSAHPGLKLTIPN